MSSINNIRLSTAVPNAKCQGQQQTREYGCPQRPSTDVAVDMVANTAPFSSMLSFPLLSQTWHGCASQQQTSSIVFIVVNDIRNKPGPCWSVRLVVDDWSSGGRTVALTKAEDEAGMVLNLPGREVVMARLSTLTESNKTNVVPLRDDQRKIDHHPRP